MFTEEQKMVFKFKDSDGSDAYADPLRVQRRLDEAMRKADLGLQDVFTILDGGSKDALKPKPSDPAEFHAWEIRQFEFFRTVEALVPCIHDAFETHGVDRKTGEGLTEGEAIANFGMLFRYFGELKKNGETSPDSSDSGESGHQDSNSPTS